MINGQCTEIFFSALEKSELPALEEYYNGNDPMVWIEEGNQFDHALLEQQQMLASRVKELRDLIIDYDIPDYPIVFCRLLNLLGATYLEGDIWWPLMFLDTMRANTLESFRETYIHEAAHLASNGQDHDFVFAVTNNFLRMKTGLLPSDSDYDHRMCGQDGQSLTEYKILSALCAGMSIKSGLSLETSVMIANLVAYKMHNGSVNSSEVEEIFRKYT